MQTVAPDTDEKRVDRGSLTLSSKYAPPTSELEDRVAAAFTTSLRVEPIGMDDDFFELGGDSLIAEELSLRLSDLQTDDFPIARLFDQPTPRAVAQGLAADTPAQAVATASTVFMVHGAIGYTMPKPALIDALGGPDRLHMFELPGLRDGRGILRSVREIASAYVAQVQRANPDGPAYLAGMCAGCYLALEMACQLSDAGRAPRAVVLIDPPVPPRLRDRARASRQNDNAGVFRWLQTAIRYPELQLLPRPFGRAAFRLKSAVLYRRIKLQNQLTARDAQRARQNGLNQSAMAWFRTAVRTNVPRSYPGEVLRMISTERLTITDEFWRDLCPEGETVVMTGKHGRMFSEHGDFIGNTMRRQFEKAGF